eukprot:TRINITY_DN338_c1_g1_i7.p2 TRINITY_DN338_c1_g1~~TRINITY_DN338_c1_g1_i7.p2  ORF type:complete len:210 (-),score=-0.82 TRINITY_DN338_c1_g1_i7:293-922(-)
MLIIVYSIFAARNHTFYETCTSCRDFINTQYHLNIYYLFSRKFLLLGLQLIIIIYKDAWKITKMKLMRSKLDKLDDIEKFDLVFPSNFKGTLYPSKLLLSLSISILYIIQAILLFIYRLILYFTKFWESIFLVFSILYLRRFLLIFYFRDSCDQIFKSLIGTFCTFFQSILEKRLGKQRENENVQENRQMQKKIDIQKKNVEENRCQKC